MDKKVYVMIPPGAKGEVIVQAVGFEGSTCEIATGPILRGLGGTTVSETLNTGEQLHSEHVSEMSS